MKNYLKLQEELKCCQNYYFFGVLYEGINRVLYEGINKCKAIGIPAESP